MGGVAILRDVIPPTTQDKDIRQKNVSSSKTSLEKLNSQTLSSILENLSQLFYIVDAKWNLIYINKRGANQAYLKPEKPGKNFWQRFPEVSGTEYERRLREAMDKKLNGSFEWKKPDGKWMDIKIFVLDNGLSVYVQDITRCKQMQEKIENQAKEHEKLITEATQSIRKSEQKYRELYESFDEAFIATDWELNVIHWNKAAERITKVKAEDALGKKVYTILPEMNEVNVAPFYEMLREGRPARFQMNTVNRQTERDANFEISTYASEIGIIIIVEDVTEQEKNKRLSFIGQLAGMIGHDIRNPLQAIISELYFAKESIKESQNNKGSTTILESIQIIQEQVDYINKIVSDLQDYARPLNPEIKEVDLTQLITGTFSAITVPDNIALSVDVAGGLKIRTDPTFLRRSLTNLVNNAVQAMPEGGNLNIAVFHQEDEITITIEDTGEGIPEDVKPKLFTPLFTTKSKGQGFGLAVTKRLVESLGGSIDFQSEEGKGTKFIIELPA